MDIVIISADEPQEPELLSFPVVCLYLIQRRPDLTTLEHFAIWQKIRDLVNGSCGGEAAFVGRDGGLLFYPNNYTPMLTALLTEPAFFDLLEGYDFDGRALKLFFHHSYRWSGHPWRPATPALEAEEQVLPAFNEALRQMSRFSETLQPIALDAPHRRVLCSPMPPMKWFMKPLPRKPADQDAANAIQKTGTDL